MSDTAKRRLSIDLDEIERQLRHGGPQAGTSKSDPLSELARIVGQDDPFGALLDEDAGRRRPQARAPQAGHAPQAADPYDDPRAEYAAHGFAVDEDGYARAGRRPGGRDDVYEEAYEAAEQGYEEPYEEPYDDAWDETRADDRYAPPGDDAGYDDDADAPYAEERRGVGRKSVVTAAALIVVAMVGVGTALWFSGSVDQASGEPPLIAANPEPARVAPAEPGGREIPNQDTALLDRAEGETRIVDREEQPLDISGQSPARIVAPAEDGVDPIASMLGESRLGGLDPGLQSPLVPSQAVAALGEPRRVRTVTVRPDGSVVSPVGLEPPAPTPAPAPTASAAPTAAPDLPPPAADLPVAPAAIEPAPSAAEPSIETLVAAAPPVGGGSPDLPVSALSQPAASAATPAPLPPPAPARTAQPAPSAPAPASNQPLQLSSLPPVATAPTPATSAPADGGYAVQLAIRGSEDRARQAYEQLRGQYAAIIGDGEPIIRQAVVNGNTIYRVRVGPYSLERANQACEQIKAASGDCFVAPNR